MAAVVPDPKRIKPFRDSAAFEKWLAAHHDRWPELWLKIHKKDSGLRSITAPEALDVCLCFGWIDGIRKSFDGRSFLQRYSPRAKASAWSRINRDNVARLIEAGRMTPRGLREVEAAKADGRWDAAYASARNSTADSLPADLREAIEANPRARKALATLDRANLFALGFRTSRMRTPAGRARKIEELVATLAGGRSIVAGSTSRPPRK